MSVLDQFNSLSIERREAILNRAEDLIRAERAGRYAPESNRNAAATAACVLMGVVLGLLSVAAVVVF